jgi:hypothetical protein
MSAGLALLSSLTIYKFSRVPSGLFDKDELTPRGPRLVSAEGQQHRFDSRPVTSGLPQ